jgi:hypothetical protein
MAGKGTGKRGDLRLSGLRENPRQAATRENGVAPGRAAWVFAAGRHVATSRRFAAQWRVSAPSSSKKARRAASVQVDRDVGRTPIRRTSEASQMSPAPSATRTAFSTTPVSGTAIPMTADRSKKNSTIWSAIRTSLRMAQAYPDAARRSTTRCPIGRRLSR